MDQELAIAQALRYAQELRTLHAQERAQRAEVEKALAQVEQSYATTVRALAAALELRDDDTGGHAARVTRVALALTRKAAPDLADEPKLEYGFLLHDIGKIGIPDAILLKPGPLTDAEMEEMRRHPALGEQILGTIPYLSGVAREVAASHHERWDGNGYPRGLSGTQIPLPARIFAIADTFDAMTSDRPYRAALPVATALAEIADAAGTQFDPELAGRFVSLADGFAHAA